MASLLCLQRQGRLCSIFSRVIDQRAQALAADRRIVRGGIWQRGDPLKDLDHPAVLDGFVAGPIARRGVFCAVDETNYIYKSDVANPRHVAQNPLADLCFDPFFLGFGHQHRPALLGHRVLKNAFAGLFAHAFFVPQGAIY